MLLCVDVVETVSVGRISGWVGGHTGCSPPHCTSALYVSAPEGWLFAER